MDKSKIESVFPLTELQSTMLLQHLKKTADDAGFLQLQVTLKGVLDIDALIEVWNRMTAAYKLLRTTVHWENIKQYVQIVHREIEVDICHQDYRQLSQVEAENKINSFLEKDRETNLELSKVPCWRLTLFQTDRETHRFVWSCHHILFDGWSSLELLNKMKIGYNRLKQGSNLVFDEIIPFQTYCKWLKKQPETIAARYWKAQFAEIKEPRLLVGRSTSGAGKYETVSLASDVFSMERLREIAQVFQVTPSILLFGAWAIIVSELTQSLKVVIGITVSGRSAPIEGIESMLGMLANILPLCLEIDGKTSIKSWFQTVFKQRQELSRFEHNSLGQIYKWTDIPPHIPFFDSILVHANQPWEQGEQNRADGKHIEITQLEGDVTSGYPVTLIVKPEALPALEIRFDSSHIELEFCRFIANRFQEILSNVYYRKDEPLEALIKKSPETYVCPLLRSKGPRLTVDTPSTDEKEPDGQWSEIELQLREIWSKILGSNKIVLQDNFFDLGGNSLTTLQLLDTLRDRYGVTIPIESFIQNPTVSYLSKWIKSNRAGLKTELATIKFAQKLGDETANEAFHTLIEQVYREHSSPFLDPHQYLWKDRRRYLGKFIVNQLPYSLFSRFHRWCLSYPIGRRICLSQQFKTTRQDFFACLDTKVGKDEFLKKSFVYDSLSVLRVPLSSQKLSQKKHAQLAKQSISESKDILETAIAKENGILIVGSHDNGHGRQPLREILPPMFAQLSFFSVGDIRKYIHESGLNPKIWLPALASQMLSKATETLKSGGIVTLAGDAPTINETSTVERNFHGRKRLFPTGYAHLALTTKALVFVHLNLTDTYGNVYPKLFGPLDKGNESDSYSARIESLVDQYLKLLYQMWTKMPWMVGVSQMEQHLTYL